MIDESVGKIEVEFGGQRLLLLADRAVYWPARETLLIADIHLGKGAAFRTAGVPVPSGATVKDLARLEVLLRTTRAQRLVVLGDFIHARDARQPEVLESIARWRRGHNVRILLVRGNHDLRAGNVPAEWNIEEVEEPFAEGGMLLSHSPCSEDEPLPTLAGHIHPIFRMRDFDGTTVAVPCFVLDGNCFILPAFGTFTGGEGVSMRPGRRIYVIAGGRVIPIRPDQKS
ncbi:MAG TPA: ligase-associated DNA damage response endonuclease PdeM [Tepidisphaeraceae bacterium]|jgi:DNA ligase-associated metallophosphoesterase